MGNPPFARTVCACSDCTDCCRQQPGFLVPSDIPKISEYLRARGEDHGQYLVASPGALVGVVGSGGMTTYRVGTIVPRTVAGTSRCVFLDDEDHCRIHPVAPFGCAMFDSHMGAVEAQFRSSWGVRQAMDAEYQRARELMPAASSYKPFARS